MRSKILVLVCAAAVEVAMVTGCATTAQKTSVQAQAEDIQRPQFETFELPLPSEGSLWTDAGSTKLFGDMRASEIGDLVTVRISEKPTGKLSAKTETSRDSSVDAGIDDLLGYMKALQAKNPPNFDRKSMFKASFKPSFVGEGKNNRQGEVEAYVTARVVQVLPNGHLRILGKQEIRVNNETQYIALSGIIRPEDIDTNNEIQSAYIADARIAYSGKGVIADKQRPGWLTRVLDNAWPF
jgi:flagellar L-ring protein precursor FlgH